MGNIKDINKLFEDFQSNGKTYKKNIGEGVSKLDPKKTSILTKDIPNLLADIFPKKTYKIKGSIGQGRISKCPWIAIMNKNVTTSTQEGVYLVFLLSSDLQNIYFQLGQGVTKTSEDIIVSKRKEIRDTLGLENVFLKHFNEQSIDDEKYKKCAIYAIKWDTKDSVFCEKVLTEYKEAYEKYVAAFVDKKIVSASVVYDAKTFSIESIIASINKTGLIYSDMLIKRLAFSLMAKPFVILSGLAGSGKTQLALAFAKCLSENIEEQVCTVSIGADWTNREPLLGYPNALKSDEYVKPESGVLQLIMRANDNPTKPYFLILDEMNLSVVERYFADFLSAMESREPIKLWDGKDYVPSEIPLPKNVFIIGTINVDETTYMFSPKVLDRANVIEFKIATEEMDDYLNKKINIDIKKAYSVCADMSIDFVKHANSRVEKDEKNKDVLLSFFKELKKVNAEFGYRSVNEISRYLHFSDGNMDNDYAIDTAILQKLLPKLHGSRKKLVPVLSSMWKLCLKAGVSKDIEADFAKDDFKYPESAEKIQRMYYAVVDNGFTSFAEA